MRNVDGYTQYVILVSAFTEGRFFFSRRDVKILSKNFSTGKRTRSASRSTTRSQSSSASRGDGGKYHSDLFVFSSRGSHLLDSSIDGGA